MKAAEKSKATPAGANPGLPDATKILLDTIERIQNNPPPKIAIDAYDEIQPRIMRAHSIATAVREAAGGTWEGALWAITEELLAVEEALERFSPGGAA
jgi:hypothetical protein